MHTRQQEIFNQGARPSETIFNITVGTVVDTNDPQQMGRLRVVCPQWGDSWGTPIDDLPWAIYVSPFGGQVQVGSRGPGVQESEGSVAYGMWAIPKVGAQVTVFCFDGNPMTRAYFGCIHDQFTTHTLPHGRYMYEDHPELEKDNQSIAPYGPYTSSEKLIQPLAANLHRAFSGVPGAVNYEYQSRGADYTATRVDVEQLDQTFSKVQDDGGVEVDGRVVTQGYHTSRLDPIADGEPNLDSSVYSFTSPGFHSLSLDDRQENCRIRLRTTSGHQIIMDDTNERIYIATAQGNNWIELDQDGNIDVYTSNKLSIHAQRDINITSDETVRIYGKQGVHIKSDQEVRTHASGDIHTVSEANVRMQAEQSMLIESTQSTSIRAAQNLTMSADNDASLLGSSNTSIQGGGTLNLKGGSQVLVTGSTIHLNGPEAGSAPAASSAGGVLALWTNRLPQHEPWARTMTKTDMTHEPEFPYSDDRVNKVERDRLIERGAYWRR